MNLPIDFSMEDVQNLPDLRALAIDKVGIKALRHPITVKDRRGEQQHTVAVFSMYVHLPHAHKGTHMSRFIEILNVNEQAFSISNFKVMLSNMVDRLDANSGHIEMMFPYFVNKSAPVSGIKSLLDYEVSFIGEIKQAFYPRYWS